MQRLNIELFFALEIDEPHCRTRRCFRNALGIPIIVLLSFNIGANILGRHQSHFVSSGREKSTKVMSAAACFHNNSARWHAADKLNERLTSHRSTDKHCTFVINAHNAAAILPMSMPSIEIVMIWLLIPSMTRHHTRCLGRAGHPITNTSAFTRGLTFASITRFTGTRTFILFELSISFGVAGANSLSRATSNVLARRDADPSHTMRTVWRNAFLNSLQFDQ